MDITRYTLITKKTIAPTNIAVVADTHDMPTAAILEMLRQESPDMILIPGDLTDSMMDTDNEQLCRNQRRAIAFLKRAAAIAPTFYSVGNHERVISEKNKARINKTGAVLLDDDMVFFGGMCIGGLSSGFRGGKQGTFRKTPPPDLAFLDSFAAQKGFKLLLCHHPEYYPRHIRRRDVDLTVSGHAHGGQWRLGHFGMFAPGQGPFPRYTEGVHEGRLVISRGLSNHTPIPRIFNRGELVMLSLLTAMEK